MAKRKIQSVLISGAGCAGQGLAYWLHRHGFEPTVVERAPAPRIGGFAIDLRGVAVGVAQRMGIVEACRKARVNMQEIALLDQHGEVVWKIPGSFDGNTEDIEILRDDLTHIIGQALPDDIEFIFGDTITSLEQKGDGVDVTFKKGKPRRFDLVIGCDGLHSVVRKLTFGEKAKTSPLGYYVAIFSIPNFLNMDRQWHICNVPGKMIGVLQYGHDKHTRGQFIVESPLLEYDHQDVSAQMDLIEKLVGDESSWVAQPLLKLMREKGEDLYFDEVSQVRMAPWSRGRVSLVGDAAFAPSLMSGQGTSMALVGGYVLAGELKEADGDYAKAFERYEAAMRDYVEKNQRIAQVRHEMSIPRTWEEVHESHARMRAMQDQGFEEEPSEDSIVTMTMIGSNAITLKDYG